MKKIIVPTDFSATAENALAYAMQFAVITDRPLKVVHIIHPGTFVDTGLPSVLNELRIAKEAQLNRFITQCQETKEKELLSMEIEQEVVLGFPAEELIKLSKEKDSDFIIMGTTGSKGILNKLLGSVSTDVSQRAHCPVWLVPSSAKFNGVNQILYTGNYESANSIMMEAIVNVSEIFGGSIHLVHVNDPKKNKSDWKFEELVLEKLFRKEMPEFPLQLHTIQSDTFWKGINDYVAEKNIDLIVMVTHHRPFWERLSHKSRSKEVLLHTKVPLLILHLDDAV